MEKNLNQTNMKILTREEHREAHSIKPKQIPMVITYNFDSQVNVYLFNSEEELWKEITKQIEEEVRINIKEREMEVGVDFKQIIDEDSLYARLEEYHGDETDITEWSVGTLCKA